MRRVGGRVLALVSGLQAPSTPFPVTLALVCALQVANSFFGILFGNSSLFFCKIEGGVGNRGLKKIVGMVWSCRVDDSDLDTCLGFCWR